MQVVLRLDNAKEIEEVFRKAPAIAAQEYRKSLEVIATSVQRSAILAAPVNKHSGGGNLRQSIKVTSYGSTGFIVAVNSEYGVFVDQGTKPHVILPKNKPYLAFIGRDGNWVRTKRVNHPGTKPTYFFTNAVKEAELMAGAEMIKAMDRVRARL